MAEPKKLQIVMRPPQMEESERVAGTRMDERDMRERERVVERRMAARDAERRMAAMVAERRMAERRAEESEEIIRDQRDYEDFVIGL